MASAGVHPEHKYKVVEALQAAGHTVGMTGDGVNDAPALAVANAGIAVADATDAARGAADIVLTREGLSTIVSAITARARYSVGWRRTSRTGSRPPFSSWASSRSLSLHADSISRRGR